MKDMKAMFELFKQWHESKTDESKPAGPSKPKKTRVPTKRKPAVDKKVPPLKIKKKDVERRRYSDTSASKDEAQKPKLDEGYRIPKKKESASNEPANTTVETAEKGKTATAKTTVETAEKGKTAITPQGHEVKTKSAITAPAKTVESNDIWSLASGLDVTEALNQPDNTNTSVFDKLLKLGDEIITDTEKFATSVHPQKKRTSSIASSETSTIKALNELGRDFNEVDGIDEWFERAPKHAEEKEDTEGAQDQNGVTPEPPGQTSAAAEEDTRHETLAIREDTPYLMAVQFQKCADHPGRAQIKPERRFFNDTLGSVLKQKPIYQQTANDHFDNVAFHRLRTMANSVTQVVHRVLAMSLIDRSNRNLRVECLELLAYTQHEIARQMRHIANGQNGQFQWRKTATE